MSLFIHIFFPIHMCISASFSSVFFFFSLHKKEKKVCARRDGKQSSIPAASDAWWVAVGGHAAAPRFPTLPVSLEISFMPRFPCRCSAFRSRAEYRRQNTHTRLDVR